MVSLVSLWENMPFVRVAVACSNLARPPLRGPEQIGLEPCAGRNSSR